MATDNRGHVSILQDGVNGFLVHVGDHEKMAQRVLELAENSQMREQFAGADISEFGVDVITKKIYDTLNQVERLRS